MVPPGPEEKQNRSGNAGDRFAASYRTIYSVAALTIAVAAVAVWYFVFRVPPVGPTPTPEPPSPSVTTARFTGLGGSVKIRTVGSPEWRDATPDLVLHKGDLIRTGRDSVAEITFFEGSVMHMRPESLITIEEALQNPDTKKPGVRSTFSTGTINLNARNPAEIITPNFSVRQGADSQGQIGVGGGGESVVKIFSGQGSVKTNGGQTVALGKNEGLRVDAKGQASEKVVLPTVPQLVSPVDEAGLVYPNPAAATTTLQWKEVVGAESYRVMVDSNPQFFRPLVDQVHTATAYQVRGLEIGKYYWRVSAVGKTRAEGSFSDPARFTVSRPAAVAPGAQPSLTIESLDVRGSILQVKGRAEAGATVTINGEAVQVHPDGSFNEFIGLEKTGKQDVKIRVVGLNGGIREDTRSVVVAF